MKLGAMNLKKLLRNRDTWIVIGGAAAAVTAIAVVSGRGSSSAQPSFGYPGDGGMGGGGGDTGDPSEPGGGQPPGGSDPVIVFPPIVWPSSSVSAPKPAKTTATTFVDRFGNPATVEQIMSQTFPIAGPTVAATSSTPAAPPAVAPQKSAMPAPAAVAGGGFVDRFGNSVTLAELLGQSFLTNSDARQAPSVTAIGSAYAVPAPAALFVEPVIASKIKTPGGGLAYPGGGVETYIGGGGSPLGGDTRVELAA